MRGIDPYPDEGSSYQKARKRLPSALAESWPYSTFGIIIALLLSLAHLGCSWLGDAIIEPWSKIFRGLAFFTEHLSVGFFVSSIAVFFYEWGAHAKDALALSHQLRDLLAARGVEAIGEGMARVFTGRDDLLSHHQKFIAALKSLYTKRNWASDADVAFLTLFVKQAADHADRLKSLRDHLHSSPDDADQEFHLDFKEKTEFADKILTAQMDLLASGDSYDTLSNPRTWSALKTGFYEACVRAVTKGAQMRRVFIMGLDNDIHHENDVRNLVHHYQFAVRERQENEKGGWYRIQLATPKIFTDFRVEVRDQHYGIFRRGNDAVAFKVIGNDVSNFVLVAAPRQGDLARNFDAIWKKLEWEGDIVSHQAADARKGSSRFIDAALSRELSHLDAHGRFEMASTSRTWRNFRSLPAFRAALKRVSVRHLFVLSANESVKDIAELLVHPGAGQEAAPGREGWVVKFCRQTDVAAQFPNWQFPHCRFHNGREPMHPYVFSVDCRDDLSDFILAEERQDALNHAMAFDQLWATSGEVS